MDLGLPSFNTVTFNANLICDTRLKSSINSLVQADNLAYLSVCMCVRAFLCVCVYVYAFVLWAYEINVHSFIHSFIFVEHKNRAK